MDYKQTEMEIEVGMKYSDAEGDHSVVERFPVSKMQDAIDKFNSWTRRQPKQDVYMTLVGG